MRIALILLICITAYAGRPTTRPSTVVPIVQQRDRIDNWQACHVAVLEYLKAHPPEIIMIGDSITQLWGGQPVTKRQPVGNDSWTKTFGANSANLGFCSDRTENVLWRVDHGELDGINPKQIVLMIGVNNLGNAEKDIALGIETVARRIHEKLPKANLLLIAILPNRQDSNPKTLAKRQRINVSVRTALQNETLVTLADFNDRFLAPDKKLDTSLFSDGLHPNARGYEILGQAIREILGKSEKK